MADAAIVTVHGGDGRAERRALVDADGIVQNIVEWHPETPYDPPSGLVLAECSPRCDAGWRIVDGQEIAPEPQPGPREIPTVDFMDRFSERQQIAVKTAAMRDPHIGLWYDRMLAVGSVHLDHERTRGGIATLVQAGLITQAEADDVLA